MTKNEFIDKLCQSLRNIPPEEANKTVMFYSEAIDDRIEDGATEEEAVAAMGSIDDIVREVTDSLPLTKIVKERFKEKKSHSTWWIVLAIIGFPIWLPILISIAAVLLSVYIVVCAVLISIAAVFASFILAGIATVVAAFILPYTILAPRLMLIGAGLFILGLSVLIVPALNYLTKWLAQGTKAAYRWLKSLFLGKKEDEQ